MRLSEVRDRKQRTCNERPKGRCYNPGFRTLREKKNVRPYFFQLYVCLPGEILSEGGLRTRGYQDITLLNRISGSR